jgi:hypothetical protein
MSLEPRIDGRGKASAIRGQAVQCSNRKKHGNDLELEGQQSGSDSKTPQRNRHASILFAFYRSRTQVFREELGFVKCIPGRTMLCASIH